MIICFVYSFDSLVASIEMKMNQKSRTLGQNLPVVVISVLIFSEIVFAMHSMAYFGIDST